MNDPLQSVEKRIAEVAGQLAETAARLRRAIADGMMPPKATEKLAARLSDLAARMQREHGTQPAPNEAKPEDT